MIFLTTGERPKAAAVQKESDGSEYWASWIMAYYQRHSGMRFSDIVENGLTVSKVLSLYILHEADESKFVETADQLIARNKQTRMSKLSLIRKARGFTQQQLADQSGVKLRMIQLYEQRQNNINKAQTNVVLSLSKALGCEIEDILE